MTKSSRFDYGWIVVGAGALMTCVGFGAMLSLAVFLQPISEAMGWSRAGVSAAATIDFLCMAVAAFFWGTLSDRFGTRIVVLAGSLLLGLGLVTASQAQSLWQFQLLFGGLIGIAAGSFYAPMMAVASAWISQHRSLAVSLVSAGMGVAPLTVAPTASWLITTYDWRTAMLVIGIASWALLIPASFLVRPAPQSAEDASARYRHAGDGLDRGAGVPHAAIHHAGAGAFRLLRGAFRPDLPHGLLCDDLRHRAAHRRHRLQPRRLLGPRRAPVARCARGSRRRQAGAGRRPPGAGILPSRPILRSRISASSTRSRSCSASPMAG